MFTSITEEIVVRQPAQDQQSRRFFKMAHAPDVGFSHAFSRIENRMWYLKIVLVPE